MRYLRLLLVALVCLSLHYNICAQTITTIAGNGLQGYSGDNGGATNANLNTPTCLVRDNIGNVYFADVSNYRIRKISVATGTISTFAGTGVPGYNGNNIAATNAQLQEVLGLASDGIGNIYISDWGGNRIRKVNAAGIITTVAGTGLSVYNGDGIPATTANIAGPAGLKVDESGNIYFAEHSGNKIRKINGVTGIISTIPTGFAALAPRGLALDDLGNIYFTEQIAAAIVQKFNIQTSVISTVAGTGAYGYTGDNIPATAAAIFTCYGISVDGAGNVYFADNESHRIRKVTAATGMISTVVGNGMDGYNGDNIPATNAHVTFPEDVILDTFKNMYIADFYDYRVRKVYVTCDTIFAGAISHTGPGIYCDTGSALLTLPSATVGTYITYKWLSSTDGITWVTAGTGDSLATGTLMATHYYKAIMKCIPSGAMDSTGVAVIIIDPPIAPSVSISATPGTTVAPGVPVTFTATVTNGGNNPIYQWQKNHSNIPSATAATYTSNTLANNDTITCKVKRSAPCPDSGISNRLVMHITTGIPWLSNNDAIVYPNPNNGIFNIRMPGINEAGLAIYDLAGREVYNETLIHSEQQIDLRYLDAGTYILQLRAGDGSRSIQKVMITK